MQPEKKICLIITQPEWGGAQRYVYDLSLGLKENGLDVTVCTGRGTPVLLDKLSGHNIKTHQFVHMMREILPIEEAYAFFELWHYFRENHFDVVHLNSSKAGVAGALAAKMAGVKKVVFTAHGFIFNEKLNIFRKWFYIFLTWLSLLFTDKVIAVSEYDKHSALRLRIVSRTKIETIYNGVDIKEGYFLEKNEAREKLSKQIGHGLSQDAKIIGTIANFYPNKGLRYLVDSASRVCREIAGTIFIVMGDGAERKEIERYIKRHQLEANFLLLGFVESPERLLKAFDVYASASLKEGLPYSLIEARASGVPVVATAVGGVPEIIGSESGVLVPREDSKALAEQIVSILKNNRQFQPQKDKFLLKDMIGQTIKVYGII